MLVYRDRIAVEFFHALTDGTGGLIFLKTLVAEYLTQKYGVAIPAENGVLGRLEEPDPEELEDSFLHYAGDVTASRKEATAYHLSGTAERDGYKNLITMMLSADAVRACAKARGISVTELLCAAMMQAILNLQAEKVRDPRRRKPVKVLVPVNLRSLFPSRTLRNFASYITPELDPRMGECSFEELCGEVHHRMGLENNRRTMRAKFAANVASEKSPVLRVMPLFIKNIAMKAVFDAVGECKSCLCLSNLGNVQLPEAMAPYVQQIELHHRRAGRRAPRLRCSDVERHHVYQLHPQHPRAGAGDAFLPCAAAAGAPREGGEQPALIRERSENNVLYQMRRGAGRQ